MTLFLGCSMVVHSQSEYKTFYYDDGTISSEGYMLNGKPDGYWQTFYPDGKLKTEGNRKDLQLDSTWIFYSETGNKTSEINYENGKRNGASIMYKEGVKYSEVTFRNDTLIEKSYIYYPTGEIQREIPYMHGVENGTGYEFDRDGRIITLLLYKDGNLRSSDKINRLDNQGKKRGSWMGFHPNGALAEEGYFMNGKKNGIFKTYDSRGSLLSLNKYRDDVLVNDSEASIILDMRNTYYPDGIVKSSGGYVNGLKEGTHRIYDENGEIIAGEVYGRGEKIAEGVVDKTGSFQGPWKEFYDTGELKAEGEYKNSERSDLWKFYHKNGALEHRGKFTEGQPQGEWKWYFDNGNLRREELYRRGKEDGSSVEYDLDGAIITQGQYINGYKDGEWFYHVGDHIEKGSYLDGERTGDWRFEYPDGEKNFEGEFVAGLAVGKHKWYYPNAQLKKEGKYSSGVRVGTWITFNEEGEKILEVKYKNGEEFKINGRKILSTNGDELP